MPLEAHVLSQTSIFFVFFAYEKSFHLVRFGSPGRNPFASCRRTYERTEKVGRRIIPPLGAQTFCLSQPFRLSLIAQTWCGLEIMYPVPCLKHKLCSAAHQVLRDSSSFLCFRFTPRAAVASEIKRVECRQEKMYCTGLLLVVLLPLCKLRYSPSVFTCCCDVG